jgi:hypothetical protein
MVKWLLKRGANPFIMNEKVTRIWYPGIITSPFKEMCSETKAEAGLAMYHRSMQWKITIIHCFGAKLGGEISDVLPLILKFAGIGEKRIADKKTPWIPTMPLRADVSSNFWGSCYNLIDLEIGRRTENRRKQEVRKRRKNERERRIEMGDTYTDA